MGVGRSVAILLFAKNLVGADRPRFWQKMLKLYYLIYITIVLKPRYFSARNLYGRAGARTVIFVHEYLSDFRNLTYMEAGTTDYIPCRPFFGICTVL